MTALSRGTGAAPAAACAVPYHGSHRALSSPCRMWQLLIRTGRVQCCSPCLLWCKQSSLPLEDQLQDMVVREGMNTQRLKQPQDLFVTFPEPDTVTPRRGDCNKYSFCGNTAWHKPWDDCSCLWLCFQGDFGTQKEAAWAISNLTISGRKDQVSPALGKLPFLPWEVPGLWMSLFLHCSVTLPSAHGI